MASVAMFLARPPGPPMTGRKTVLLSALAALVQEGHEVDLFVLADGGEAPALARRTFWLGAARKPAMLGGAVAALLTGAPSLNEALFRSRRALACARRVGRRYDFAFADTIRVARYASELGVPWHLDLDDLLSARYEKYLEGADGLSVDLLLGYYRASVPRLASALPKALLVRLLRGEAARMRARELYWAARANTVSLVSPLEAERFARAAGRPVHSLPMSVPLPAHCWSPAAAGPAPVFVGGLDYKPNLDAVLYYLEQVLPALNAANAAPPVLVHIGNAPPEARRRAQPGAMLFEGYVDDLAARLARAAFFLAPIVSGSGIKTKVLEAMAAGLPVLATPQAVAGLGVEHRKHCFVCTHAADFAEGLRWVRDAAAASAMGLAARAYVEANFSAEVLRRRWRGVVRELAC
jgi:glycosyltransferase involved in cell wall biosynthesis